MSESKSLPNRRRFLKRSAAAGMALASVRGWPALGAPRASRKVITAVMGRGRGEGQ
jgi:uncharacterized protein (DUF1501 family)